MISLENPSKIRFFKKVRLRAVALWLHSKRRATPYNALSASTDGFYKGLKQVNTVFSSLFLPILTRNHIVYI